MRSPDIVAVQGLPGVRVIVPHRHQDARGFLSEVWREDAMTQAGIHVRFMQENHVLSNAAGTVRGLHFQVGGAAQAKLIRCLRGSIFDVAVDIRRGSPSFGHYTATVLNAENWKQLYVPVGFAHGYCTLQPETEVLYKVTSCYDPAAERGLAWDDPAIAVAWPVGAQAAILAEKDRSNPPLDGLPDFFPFADFPD
jgi:dTDP-4-dehydrorhamnose 3,5-epimerase